MGIYLAFNLLAIVELTGLAYNPIFKANYEVFFLDLNIFCRGDREDKEDKLASSPSFSTSVSLPIHGVMPNPSD